MVKKTWWLFAILSLIIACTTVQPPKTHQINGAEISWKDLGSVNADFRKAFPSPKGEGVYMFSRILPTKPYKLSNGDTITSHYELACNRYLYANNMELYTECYNKGVRLKNKSPRTTLPFTRFVQMAEQAVKKQGECQWLGYDRAFDLEVRRYRALASASDERLFFARLRCS